MLALTNIALRRGRKVLFENATMQLHAGQRMGVIGANGCGKSSLFAMLLGEPGHMGKGRWMLRSTAQDFLSQL